MVESTERRSQSITPVLSLVVPRVWLTDAKIKHLYSQNSEKEKIVTN
jgi:hypothetical protein